MATLACDSLFTVCLCEGCKALFPVAYACCPTCGCEPEPELGYDLFPTVREDRQLELPELVEPRRR